MYKKFFGFKERPFQLVPNPAYLYLSKSHEEALAHLTYAISQGDGFVEITGEVGTGKTTLCRVFLESLNQNTEVAYIFNPKLDSVQLLKAVNDDFGIDSQPDTIKGLIDILNVFLMRKKNEGKKIILLIDEAQNLTTEVLEQLRLLSNLETTTSKLIQIILVGQPELSMMLDSYELRQLGQRITLNCQLLPLSALETLEYIRHRLYVASGRTAVQFSYMALRVVYNYSGGTPRLINIVCDRALLTAYVLNSPHITGKIVKKAIRELSGNSKKGSYPGRLAVPVLISLVVVVAGILFYGNVNEENASITSPEITQATAEQEKTSKLTRGYDVIVTERYPIIKKTKKESPFSEEFNANYAEKSRHAALEAVLGLWDENTTLSMQLDSVEDDTIYFGLGAKQNGFSLYRAPADFSLIRRLNLPAVMEFGLPGLMVPLYLALKTLEGDILVFDNGDKKTVKMNMDDFFSGWTGVAYIPWKNFLGCTGTIPDNASEDSVLTLKMLMRDMGYQGIEINSEYDETVENAIMDLQHKYGIEVDGRVGTLTKIILYNEKNTFDIPHLYQGNNETVALLKG